MPSKQSNRTPRKASNHKTASKPSAGRAGSKSKGRQTVIKHKPVATKAPAKTFGKTRSKPPSKPQNKPKNTNRPAPSGASSRKTQIALAPVSHRPREKTATKPGTFNPKKMQTAIVAALNDAKAQDVSVLDVRKLTDVTDYLIVASGTSTRHVSGMADRVVDDLRAAGRKPIGVEGKQLGEWVLIDFGDVVVHIMRPQTRDFYNLEKLWSEDILGKTDLAADDSMERHIRRRLRGR